MRHMLLAFAYWDSIQLDWLESAEDSRTPASLRMTRSAGPIELRPFSQLKSVRQITSEEEP